MLPQEIINILIQLPIVLVFIWFFDKVTTRFEDNLTKQSDKHEAFLREERASRDKILGEILNKIGVVEDKLDAHDGKVDRKISAAIDRTVEKSKPRERAQ